MPSSCSGRIATTNALPKQMLHHLRGRVEVHVSLNNNNNNNSPLTADVDDDGNVLVEINTFFTFSVRIVNHSTQSRQMRLNILPHRLLDGKRLMISTTTSDPNETKTKTKTTSSETKSVVKGEETAFLWIGQLDHISIPMVHFSPLLFSSFSTNM
jgi:hypothetical protein